MTGDNDTITLRDAAQHFGFTVSTLRAEASRGRLTIYKIGKRYYTTPADIRVMVSECRVDPKARDFTLIRGAGNGLSAMERSSSALAAANETVQMLKSLSRATSAPSIGPRRRTHR